MLETTKDKTKIRFLKGAIRSVDVKAQDIAAQIMDTKAQSNSKDAANDTAKKAAAPVKPKEEKKKRGKKHREAAANAENK